jgi:hypothetical protein
VLTHYERDPLVMDGGTTFHFGTDGIEAALERADARVACSTSTDEIDFVVEGRAESVSDRPTLERIAEERYAMHSTRWRFRMSG